MSTAEDIAKENAEKAKKKAELAKDYENTHLQIKQLEKEKEKIKSKLDPILAVGERIGLVHKISQNVLDIPNNSPIIDELARVLGPQVVRKEIDAKALDEALKTNPNALKDAALTIPRKDRTQIRVGLD